MNELIEVLSDSHFRAQPEVGTSLKTMFNLLSFFFSEYLCGRNADKNHERKEGKMP